jgi:hypothetical protein
LWAIVNDPDGYIGNAAEIDAVLLHLEAQFQAELARAGAPGYDSSMRQGSPRATRQGETRRS